MVAKETDMQGCTVKLTWFRSAFLALDVDASNKTVVHHTRAYILWLLGGFLMADASTSRVSLKWLLLLRDFSETGRLSWGYVLLVTLYRQLYRNVKYSAVNISKCLALL